MSAKLRESEIFTHGSETGTINYIVALFRLIVS